MSRVHAKISFIDAPRSSLHGMQGAVDAGDDGWVLYRKIQRWRVSRASRGHLVRARTRILTRGTSGGGVSERTTATTRRDQSTAGSFLLAVRCARVKLRHDHPRRNATGPPGRVRVVHGARQHGDRVRGASTGRCPAPRRGCGEIFREKVSHSGVPRIFKPRAPLWSVQINILPGV